MSLGEQFKIEHSRSKVNNVILFPFLIESKVLLSIPFFKR